MSVIQTQGARVSPKAMAHMAILFVIVCRVPVKLVILKRIQVPVKNPVYAVAVLGCLWIVEFGGNGNRGIFLAWYHGLSYRRLFCVLQICDKVRRTQALNIDVFIVGFISGNDMRNTVLLGDHKLNRIFKIVPAKCQSVDDGGIEYGNN